MSMVKKHVESIFLKIYLKTILRKKYKTYSEFKKLLEKKRVCLVGPAEYIDKEFVNHGQVIDSYDVVIRVNNFINIDKSLVKNYGKKLDVLIISLWYDDRNTFSHKEAYSKENIQKPLLIYYRYNRLRRLFLSFFKINDNITICEQPKENWQELLKILKHSPTTGMAAIFDILKCNPKELYITGFTFGADLKYRSYVDKYHKFWTPPIIM
jgi:hypothetical protein